MCPGSVLAWRQRACARNARDLGGVHQGIDGCSLVAIRVEDAQSVLVASCAGAVVLIAVFLLRDDILLGLVASVLAFFLAGLFAPRPRFVAMACAVPVGFYGSEIALLGVAGLFRLAFLYAALAPLAALLGVQVRTTYLRGRAQPNPVRASPKQIGATLAGVLGPVAVLTLGVVFLGQTFDDFLILLGLGLGAFALYGFVSPVRWAALSAVFGVGVLVIGLGMWEDARIIAACEGEMECGDGALFGFLAIIAAIVMLLAATVGSYVPNPRRVLPPT